MSRSSAAKNPACHFGHPFGRSDEIFGRNDHRYVRDQQAAPLCAVVNSDAASASIFQSALCGEKLWNAKGVCHSQLVGAHELPPIGAKEDKSTREQFSGSQSQADSKFHRFVACPTHPKVLRSLFGTLRSVNLREIAA